MSPQPDNPTPGVTRHSQPASPAWLQLPAIGTRASQTSPPVIHRASYGPSSPGPAGAAAAGTAGAGLPSAARGRDAALCARGGGEGGPVRGGSEASAAAAQHLRAHGVPEGTALRAARHSRALPAARGEPQPAGLGRAGAAPVLSAGPRGRPFPAHPTAASATRPPPGLAARPHSYCRHHGQGTGTWLCQRTKYCGNTLIQPFSLINTHCIFNCGL